MEIIGNRRKRQFSVKIISKICYVVASTSIIINCINRILKFGLNCYYSILLSNSGLLISAFVVGSVEQDRKFPILLPPWNFYHPLSLSFLPLQRCQSYFSKITTDANVLNHIQSPASFTETTENSGLYVYWRVNWFLV